MVLHHSRENSVFSQAAPLRSGVSVPARDTKPSAFSAKDAGAREELADIARSPYPWSLIGQNRATLIGQSCPAPIRWGKFSPIG